MTQRFVRRGAVDLAYERRGAGAPVVLIQGLGMPGRMWLGLPGALLRLGHTVVTPDARGTGLSGGRPPFSMAQLADDVAAVVEDVGCGPALVLGISFGGMVAQHLALRRPDLVAGLVLAATTCGLPHGRPPGLMATAVLLRSVVAPSANATAALERRLVHPETLRRRPDVLRPWRAAIGQSPTRARTVVGQMMATAGHSTGFALHRICCPTEVIAGDSDLIIPTANAAILARRIRGAVHTLVSSTGHVFPIEEPRALPAAVVRVAARAAAG